MRKEAPGVALFLLLLASCRQVQESPPEPRSLKVVEQGLLQSTGASSPAAALAVTRDPLLLNDAAAGYLARRRIGEVPDVLLAAEAAERAWRMSETPATAWNRAAAREALHVPSQALAAWNDYLRLDPDSPRLHQVTSRIRRLSAPTQSRRWIAARRRLVEREELPTDLPMEMRGFGEEQLTAVWADAVLRGDDDAATRALGVASRIGERLAATSGERLLADSAIAVQHARMATRSRIAAAFVRYRSGKRLLAAQRMREAAVELSTATRLLRESRTPFAFQTALFAATAEYYATDLDLAQRHLRELLKQQTYIVVTAQAEWVIGLIEYARGHNNEALSAYSHALAAFERSGELENIAGIETLLGETYSAIGQTASAWRHQERALQTLARLGATRRSHAILTDAGLAASAWNVPMAALIFQSGVVTLARVSNDAVSLSDALIGHARYSAAAGDRTAALNEVAEVKRLIPTIADDAMRARTRANLLAAEVSIWRSLDNSRVADAATNAIAELSRLGNRTQLVRLRLEAGRSATLRGSRAVALDNWMEGIAECERQRGELPDGEYRRTYFEQCRSLFDEAVGALVDDGRSGEARTLADRNRARSLRDTRPADAVRDASAHVTTIIELSVLPDRTLIWRTDRSGTSCSTVQIGRAALQRDIEQLVGQRSDRAAFLAASGTLYDLLLRPIELQLGSRVVVVPDLDTYRIPFAALFDRVRGRYFIEDHELVITPSVSLLARSSALERFSHPFLIDTSGGQLRGAAEEISRLSKLYPAARVLPADATLSELTHSLQSADLIQIAGHAEADSELADPALVLQSRFLYPADIQSMDLRKARLVILSACGTARGRIGSDGPLSVARAFLFAGAPRVIATLWDIDDFSALSLMIRYHRLLRDRRSPSEALQTLQREAIRHSAPPADWAALEILQTEL